MSNDWKKAQQKIRARDKRDKDLYNLLPGERNRIYEHQNGRDPITGEPLKPNANLDHDHRTGLIRGLLNPMTNKMLVDDAERLRRSLQYLENPPAVEALGERVYGLVGRAKRKRKMLYGPDRTPTPRPRRA